MTTDQGSYPAQYPVQFAVEYPCYRPRYLAIWRRRSVSTDRQYSMSSTVPVPTRPRPRLLTTASLTLRNWMKSANRAHSRLIWPPKRLLWPSGTGMHNRLI